MTTSEIIRTIILLAGIGNVILVKWAVKRTRQGNRLKKSIGEYHHTAH
jgi:hypothetical protein